MEGMPPAPPPPDDSSADLGDDELDDDAAVEANAKRGRKVTAVIIAGCVALATIVAVVGVVIAAGGDDKPSVQTIRGSFSLTDSDILSRDDDCRGTGGYDDINEGLEVVVKNSTGKIIATSELGDSTPYGSGASRECTLHFVVPDVPRSDFYEIAVGRRGSLTYSQAELEEQGWNVVFTLG